MQSELFQTDEYRSLQREYLYRTIGYLLEYGIEFAIAAEVEHIDFDPPLPAEIGERLAPVSLFVLTGYTYETAETDGKNLRFEAGFGEGNFGSRVNVPLLAIKQLIVEDYPIAINIAEPEPDTSHSMEALLSNPENLKFLKKRKKS